MTYRDDREALQSRVRELEEDLGNARREGEEQGREAAEGRAKELEEKLASLRGEIDRVGAELQELRGVKPGAKAQGRPWLAVGVVGVAALGGGYLLFGAGRAEPPPAQVPWPGVPVPWRKSDDPSQVSASPTEPAKVPEKPAKQADPELEARTATARWKATVKSAEGLALAPGSSCIVEAALEAKKTNAGVDSLTVTCGSEVIYSSAEALNGMAQMGNDAQERLGPSDDRSRFTLQYSDIGTRSGKRGQIDLDTTQQQGSVFHETIPRYRVELSLPVESEPTIPLAGAAQRLRLNAHVTEVTGAAPVKVDAKCVVRAMPTGKQGDCVAEVLCGQAVLFPASTSGVQCRYEGARVTLATRSGDPLELGMSDKTVEVKATGPKAFTAVLGLDP